MRLKVTLCFLVFLVAGCDSYLIAIQPTSTPTASEESPFNLQTEVDATSEPTAEAGGQRNQDPTPELTSEVEDETYQLQAKGLQPEFVGDLDNQQDLTFYEMDIKVTLDPSHVRALIEGGVRISYTHSQESPLNELVLMLWPNDQQYNADMVAGPVQVDRQLVDSYIESGGVVLRVPLAKEVQPGEKLEISLPFEITSEGSIVNQRKRFGVTYGVLMAPTFYPLIPRFIDGMWQTEIPPEGGDTTNSDVAYYQVAITASEEYEIIASGVEVEKRSIDNQQIRVSYVTGPMRDFAFAVGPLHKISRMVDDIQLNVWVLPEHIASGERLSNATTMQMEFMNDLVGPYPYVELDIVDTPCAFGGIEYPGLIYICSLDNDYFIDTTVHEIAHQWFYGLIGNDQLHEPWLDEAAATYWQVLCYENAVGKERADGQLNQYRSWVSNPENKNAPIGLGIADYRSSGDYYTVVYFKGAVFYDALRDEMGDETFFDFLSIYYEKNRYQFVNSRDFQGTAEVVCGCDLSAFFDLWVYQGGEIPDW
ncbi:MAG: hypothetical protein A2Z14_02680 [Chloroflexi bacterium RBG_16_48_8]|nr:MAG: hypothetical protein A2Z14_02680 [Chloroflexi bacterium RBG_16_48_8]